MTTYEENRAKLRELEPWIAFMCKYEGSEIGRYWQMLSATAGAASSAAMYDHAGQIIGMLEELVADAKEEAEDGWVYEMVEMAQEDWERNMAPYQPDRRPNIPQPMDELAALATASAETEAGT